MWRKGRFGRLEEFVRKAEGFGFREVELDSFVTPEMLAEIPRLGIRVSSVHAPSPQREVGGRPHTDFFLSAPDEEERRTAVGLALATIDLASRLGAEAVVLHMGNIPPLREAEERLRRLYEEGMGGDGWPQELKEELIQRRSRLGAPFVEKAMQSLRELAIYAGSRGVKLGLENRVYFHEIPSPEEMEELLLACGADVVGYWHDTGHAAVMERLGFFPQEEWFRRFRGKMVGCHLHDVRGIRDHYPPGKGELDWDFLADSIPEEAIRVCEVGEWNEEEELKGMLSFLLRKGFI